MSLGPLYTQPDEFLVRSGLHLPHFLNLSLFPSFSLLPLSPSPAPSTSSYLSSLFFSPCASVQLLSLGNFLLLFTPSPPLPPFLHSGESLIRNLMLGRALASELGPPLPIVYLPDTFGHISQFPQIVKGFGACLCPPPLLPPPPPHSIQLHTSRDRYGADWTRWKKDE